MDLEALTLFAKQHDVVIRLEYRPGDFANTGDALAHVIPAEGITDDDLDEIHRHFSFGHERTPTQNAEFLIDQLIEILARALSPGLNDPYTALNCINWLGSALMGVAERPEAESNRLDDTGAVRIVVHPVRFERLAAAIFDRSRQYVSADRNACLEVLRVTTEAALGSSSLERRACLMSHASALEEAARQRLPL